MMLLLGRWIKTLVRFGKGKEQGQVVVMALVVLAIGGLVITTTLSHMATGAKSTSIHKKVTRELYAADAGVEHAMWKIKKGDIQFPFYESITVDDISVNSSVDRVSEMSYGPIITGSGEHTDWLKVSKELVHQGDNIYSYTIYVDNDSGDPGTTIFLVEVGAGLPDDFTYLGPCSGITTSPPIIDGKRVRFAILPNLKLKGTDPTVSQTFLIYGDVAPTGDYSWVEAEREDIGIVSTCEGFSITSQAGGTSIEANVIKNQDVVYPVSWKIY